MHKRFWFLAVAAIAVLAVAGSAAARTDTSSAQASSSAFAKAWANTPRTPAARAAKKTLVFGLEQNVTGFNLANATENAYYAGIVAGTPVIRGNYLIDQNGIYHLDLASKVVATKKYLKIWIRKDANWNWIGHALKPVTAGDYIFTWKTFMKKGNLVASTTGYQNIASAKKNSSKVVTFYWKPGQAFADYRDLFGYIYPRAAIGKQSFNQFWHNCVCGTDNHPVSDGPFYLSSYTQGQGMVLTKNPKWYGAKAGLNSIVFKIQTDTNSEIQAMKGGEYDAINPSPESALSTLVGQQGIKYSAVPGFTQEHWDIEVGPNGQPLLKNQWMRAAIMEAMNRPSLIQALYGSIAPGLKPLNNPEYEIGSPANGKYAYMAKYNFNAKGAIALLKGHGCTGGPSTPSDSNNKVWTCNGHQTVFRFDTTTRASRQQSGAIFKQQLMAVGIKINDAYHPPATLFGTILPSTDFDLAEYAWIGGPDPSGFDGIYQCFDASKNLGGSNYKRYCNHSVDALLNKADVNLNATSRDAQYEQIASMLSNDIAVIPLYASPSIFVYKSAIKGMAASNNATSEGPTWNIQQWHW